MVELAVVLFLLAAAGGLFMATRIFKGVFPPAAVAVLHGLLAATALVLVILAAIRPEAEMLVKVGAGIMFLAALGGFFLVSFHLRRLPHPRPVVVIHALVAVVGVGALILALL